MKYWLILFTLFYAASAQAQSREALAACRDISLKSAWDECLEKFDARLKVLQQDPYYQSQQKRLEEERRFREKELRLREEDAKNQQRIAEELEELRRNQNKQRSFNCTVMQGVSPPQLSCY